eukprot:XP_015580518.1 pentatricopeptide repeat-containing protein At5g03800 [Ricinus communis]
MAAIIQPTALLTCFHSLHFPSKPPLIVPLHTCLFKPKQQHHHQPRFSVSTAQSLLSSNPTLSSHRNIEPLFGLHSKYDTFIDIGIDHLLNLLRISVRYTDFDLARALHASILKLGEDTHLGNALVVAYLKLGLVLDAYEVFKGLCNPDVVSYSSLISSFAKGNQEMKAIELFFRMRSSGVEPNEYSYVAILTACIRILNLELGFQVHALLIKLSYLECCGSLKDVMSVCERMPVRDVITWTQMIAAYMEFGLVDLAVEVFEKMPERNSVSYNALLAGFCNNGEGLKALDLFIKMVQEGAELSEFTLTSVITACGILRTLEISRQIHGFIMKFGFGSNACIETALLDMYTRCGRMNDADKMFRSWPSDRDSLVIQTSMLCGYARNGMPNEAVSLFQLSLSEGTMVVDEVALTSVLGVCGTLGSQEMGEQIHCHALKTGFLADLGVGNSIISMYSKCCNMNKAIKSFNDMLAHDVVSWNCLIAGHLLHRQGDEALAVWSRMEKAGVKPDSVTFVLIISAYSHTRSDLVEDCRDLFFSMKNIYEVEPTSEHYASFVSVLGYWGQLEEAEDMIIKMPFNPEASVWRALLDSCRLHLNTSIGKRAVKHILAMEPQDPSTYALVSNLYSASGRWHCSEIARANMRKRGLRKHPCRSWVIHQKEVHSFYVRDKAHPCAKDIYSGLDILIKECLKAGYEPDTSFVLHEVEEHQKKDFLFYHSAKLAATYGLLKTRPGEPVHIVKNILLCGDCHTFLKYVSAVTKREIIVRDTSGFHCFSNGHCSCKDYWR